LGEDSEHKALESVLGHASDETRDHLGAYNFECTSLCILLIISIDNQSGGFYGNRLR